jgi:hypothetical protein
MRALITSKTRVDWNGHSKDVIWEEREGPLPCGDQRLILPPLDCCRSDVRSDRVRTNRTSDVRRASSRRCHGALPSRAEALPKLQRPWPVVASDSTRDRENASFKTERRWQSSQFARCFNIASFIAIILSMVVLLDTGFMF